MTGHSFAGWAQDRTKRADVSERDESSAARLLALHAEVIAGDRAALEQIAVDLWRPLCRRLRREFPYAPTDLRIDASNDALLTYSARPYAFEADRFIRLDSFLFGIAARILRDRLRSDRRRLVRESVYAKHSLQRHRCQTAERAKARVTAKDIRDALRFVCNPTELLAMMAWLNEDDVGVVAARLGVSHLGPTEQRREVKRLMARVIKRLQRYFGKAEHADSRLVGFTKK